MASGTVSNQITVIRPRHGWVSIQWRELWAYREVLYFLVWRDVKVRYKQTAIGIVWAILQPLLMVLVFTLLFSVIAKIPSDGVPYPVFAFAALLPWNLFARGLSEGSTSLVANEALITKVYFPRLLLPAAAVLAGLVDFLFAFAVLIGVMLFYGMVPTIAVLTLPLFVGIATLSAFGIACWLSAIDVRYRDVRYTLPFLTQLWFYATPVVYPLSQIPGTWRWVFGLNPMVVVVDAFRWALLGQPVTFDSSLILSSLLTVAVVIGGLFYFRRTEHIFADMV